MVLIVNFSPCSTSERLETTVVDLNFLEYVKKISMGNVAVSTVPAKPMMLETIADQ